MAFSVSEKKFVLYLEIYKTLMGINVQVAQYCNISKVLSYFFTRSTIILIGVFLFGVSTAASFPVRILFRVVIDAEVHIH